MRQKPCFTHPFFWGVIFFVMLLTSCNIANRTNTPAPSTPTAIFLTATPTALPQSGKIVFYSRVIIENGRNTKTSIVDADGSSLSQIFEPYPVTWSPDGQYITFGRNYNLYIMNNKTKAETHIDAPEIPIKYVWSPDSKKMAITARDNRVGNIYIADIEEIQQGAKIGSIKLVQNNVDASELIWSPDSKYILFVYRFQEHSGDTVVVLNTVTGDKTGLYGGRSHAWSPDGKKIAYVGGEGSKGEIYLTNFDDQSLEKFQGNSVRLTENNAIDGSPAWSPDGKQIVFTSTRDLISWDIYVMNADGSNQRNLTNNPAYDSYPVWSPDGKQIAFVSDRDGNKEIYVMNADGSNVLRLTNNDVDDYDPVWQP